jgi:hypothetical protein
VPTVTVQATVEPAAAEPQVSGQAGLVRPAAVGQTATLP